MLHEAYLLWFDQGNHQRERSKGEARVKAEGRGTGQVQSAKGEVGSEGGERGGMVYMLGRQFQAFGATREKQYCLLRER